MCVTLSMGMSSECLLLLLFVFVRHFALPVPVVLELVSHLSGLLLDCVCGSFMWR